MEESKLDIEHIGNTKSPFVIATEVSGMEFEDAEVCESGGEKLLTEHENELDDMLLAGDKLILD